MLKPVIHPDGAALAADHTELRLQYELDDALTAETGWVFLTGMRALVRLPLQQADLDRQAGWNTGGFVSGYRGSPLGGYDQQLGQAKSLLAARNIRFLPAVNEELAATAVLGTQRLDADPERTVDGVFALWYGKGPGLDRAGDALRHGNAYGAARRGGVLVVVGDDHGCVSSSMSHQSEGVMVAWSMPVLHPANVAEILEFGLYGWALSRFCGAWVGLKLASETANSASSVCLDAIETTWLPPEESDELADRHNRWPDLPGIAIEARMPRKLEAARRFAAGNSIDKWLALSPHAHLGIITCGKAALDVQEVLSQLELSPAQRAQLRVYKPGLVFPLEPQRLRQFAQGLRAVLVVEEKAPILENQLRSLLYNLPDAERPRLLGKTDLTGQPLIPLVDELRPSSLLPVVGRFLQGFGGEAFATMPLAGCMAAALDPAQLASLPKRLPFYCAGCPHNLSTKVPAGSQARGGTGCHFMASWMNRDTVGLVQMGGEGVDWLAQAPFTRRRHVFQNLGDGTYFHSGSLAIRQAVAVGANITFKILYNDAVAMTGGQPVDGQLTVPQLAWQVANEGVRQIVVVRETPETGQERPTSFPPGTRLAGRSELDTLQRELRELDGVSVLIYDQTCAAELRRRRKREGESGLPTRVYIHPDLCDGCGDCSAQSNCIAIEPLDTPLGRKRRIDQTGCNKDTACLEGFCPSMVTVQGARLLQAPSVGSSLLTQADTLPAPNVAVATEGVLNMVVAGIGGTGVVTVGAILSMAGHLAGRAVSTLDYTGMAQKGGAVHSFIRLAARQDQLNQSRVDLGQAQLVLACDLVVGASAAVLGTLRPDYSRVVLDPRETPTHHFVQDPDARIDGPALLQALAQAAGPQQIARVEAHELCQQLLGNTVCANMVLLGHAWQSGWIPLPLPALHRAIELNGVMIVQNLQAFALGRLAAARQLERFLNKPDASPPPTDDLDSVLHEAERLLSQYQGAAYSQRYRDLVSMMHLRESALLGQPQAGPLTLAVARTLLQLMAYKDEYEVARLLSNGVLQNHLAGAFQGTAGRDYRLNLHLAPPWLHWRKTASGRPAKWRFHSGWRWPLAMLARLKWLRGSWLDPFGWTQERRIERQLIRHYEHHIKLISQQLTLKNHAEAIQFAKAGQMIRGFGPVKQANILKAQQREQQLATRLEIPYRPLLENLPSSPDASPRPGTGVAGQTVIPIKLLP